MEEENNHFEKLTANLKEYINTRYDIITLTATKKVATIGSRTIFVFLVTTIISLFLLFINISAAFYLSSLLKNYYLGFLLVGCFYLLLVIVLVIGRKKLIISPLQNLIITQILSDEQA